MLLIDYFKEKTGKKDSEISILEYNALIHAIEFFTDFYKSDIKIGDKVKVDQCIYGHQFNIGEVVSIVGHDSSPSSKSTPWTAEDINGEVWFLNECEFSKEDLNKGE
jgi:hypothetical protein